MLMWLLTVTADGISLYDPPEKIIPRWKVPPVEKNPEFLNNFVEQRKALVAEGLMNSVISKKTAKDSVHKSHKPSSPENSPVAAVVSDQTTKLQNDNSVSSKTIIEGSDGSLRAGKKSGKEYWQHTKKWSQGFLESYNAETDPEVKASMRDIGKDLDRWITEKEIQEAADLIEKIPEKGQIFIKQKLDKVKREMELFGPQAVMSKYGEYAEEKEEDYLWWLDLPFVLVGILFFILCSILLQMMKSAAENNFLLYYMSIIASNFIEIIPFSVHRIVHGRKWGAESGVLFIGDGC